VQKKVGINSNPKSPIDQKLLRVNEEVEKIQKDKIIELRKRRDNKIVSESLANLKKACATQNVNLFPYVLDCVEKYCTLGEIVKILKEEFGEYKTN
jgi:methylmalonyl-CoA mutase N-terminal domain/subunit